MMKEKRLIISIVLAVILMFIIGCFSGSNFTPSESECMYRCSKCGQRALMMNSVLRSQECYAGEKHEWQYNFK